MRSDAECQHHKQYFAPGQPMPCADWRCPGSPPGRAFVAMRPSWPPVCQVYSRELRDGVIQWRLDYRGPNLTWRDTVRP